MSRYYYGARFIDGRTSKEDVKQNTIVIISKSLELYEESMYEIYLALH